MDHVNKDPNLTVVVGIQNMGNTCYCNSTIQLLRACSEWDAFCLTQPFVEQLSTIPGRTETETTSGGANEGKTELER